MPTHLVVLAAGEGSRMRSNTPKVLHLLGGAPLFQHALISAARLDGKRVIVVGHGGTDVAAAAQDVDPEIHVAEQATQLGTAHAVSMAAETLKDAGGDTLILYGDTPFIRPETIEQMQALRSAGTDMVFLGFETEDPGRYGRMVTDGDMLERIVEFNDASDAEKAITLCNSGVVLADTKVLMRLVSEVGNTNAAGEFYLTDLPEIGAKQGLVARVARCDQSETLGVNTRADLARAEHVFQEHARRANLDKGVTLVSPESVHLSFDTVLEQDAVIEPFVVFGPGVKVASTARIRAFSHLEGAHVGPGASVGPYARLRPGTELDAETRIGNFVEVKNAQIGERTKVNHLSYIGDAHVGRGSNIGAGSVTCNYDGVFKHKTEIGSGVFIGSNTMMVAPVKIGDEAMTATGSVISRDVPDGDLAVARSRQDNKPGFARKLFQKLRARKAAERG